MDLNQVLIEAAKDGNMLVLKTALEKGADVNAKDGSGMTVLMYAEQKGYAEIVNFLKEKGAKEEGYWKAIANFTKAIGLNLQDAEAYCNRGLVYGEKKLTISACADFYQAGILYLKQNNKTQSLKCVNLMKKIDFSSPLIDKLQDLIDQI